MAGSTGFGVAIQIHGQGRLWAGRVGLRRRNLPPLVMFKLPLRPSLVIKNIQSALICVSFKALGTYYSSTLDYLSFGVQTNMESMKYVWKIILQNAPDEADKLQGYAFAGSMGEALELVGEPNARAIPQVGKTWPGAEGVKVYWHYGG